VDLGTLGQDVTVRRLVTFALCLAGVGAALALGNEFLPAGIPPGIIVQGLVVGGLNALVAIGLVLIYRAIRVINFAQAAIGGLGAALAVLVVTGSHVSVLDNYWVAVPLGIALAVVTGFVVDLFLSWRFTRSPRLVVTVVTIGLAQVLGVLAIEMPRLFSADRAPLSAFTTTFNPTFHVNPLTFGGDDLVAMVVVPVALVALYWFFVRTDTGVAVRAAADSSDRALLLGIPVRRLTRITWMVAAGLSGIGSILAAPLSAPVYGVGLGSFSLAQSMLVPLAAFVLAGMESLPAAVVWSLLIGVLQAAVFSSYHTPVYSEVALFVLILGGLVLMPVVRAWLGRGEGDDATATALGGAVAVPGVTPIPAALRRLPEILAGRLVVVVLVVAAAVTLPLVAGPTLVDDGILFAVYATISVALIILAGWAAQISLGQVAITSMGACVAGAFMVHLGLPFLAALLLGGVAGAALATVIGLPALRSDRPVLAVVTLAFAVVMSDYVLSPHYVGWLNPARVAPQHLAGSVNLDAGHPTWLYEVALGVLVVGIVIAVNLRRSRAARSIIAVRDNAQASSAYGISPLKTKLLAFGAAGFIAGIAGGVLMVYRSGVPFLGLTADSSISAFLAVVIGGLGSITGGVIGALYLTVVAKGGDPVWQLLGTGAGVVVVLTVFPAGLGGLVFAGRDWVVAQLARSKGLSRTGDALVPEVVATTSTLPFPPVALPTLAEGPGPANGSGAVSLAHDAALRLGALEDLETGAPGSARPGSAPDARPPDGRPALVTMVDVDAGYGRSQVLFGVGLGVAQREVLALLGTNGAGKTTVLRTVAGLLRPTKGRIGFMGRDVTDLAPIERVRSGLVTVLGGRGIFGSLSVEENLRLAAWTSRRHDKDPAFARAATERVLTLFPVLLARQHQRAGLLSGGEQQMLALGQSLLCRPKLLLIDELSLGLAPSVVADLLGVIRALAASGMTVVVVEQSVNVATAISNRATFIERGRVRFSGPTPDLSRQPELLRSVFLHAADRARVRRSGGRPATGPDGVSAVVVAALSGLPVPEPSDEPPGAGAPGPDGRPAPPAFALVGVTKRYGGVSALTDVSLSVAPGEILGVIGSNGAGKTTLLDIASGFVKADSGVVIMAGVDLTHLSAAQRAKRGVGRVFQDARLWPSMTVREALATAIEQFSGIRDPLGAALARSRDERSEKAVALRAEQLLSEFGLRRFGDSFVAELSTGTRRVVELACAVAHGPKVLLLDEPTAGIAQRESDALGELLLGLREQTGAAFIVIEHDVPLVSSLADRVICLHLGEIIAQGDATGVLNDPAVVAAYLGRDGAPTRGTAQRSPVATS